LLYENDEYGIYDNYPLFCAIWHDNVNMVKLLIEYANHNQIILNINDIVDWRFSYSKGCNTDFPLLRSINNNNIEIVKLLIEYAEENNITLNKY